MKDINIKPLFFLNWIHYFADIIDKKKFVEYTCILAEYLSSEDLHW